jgi:hypothetical protein
VVSIGEDAPFLEGRRIAELSNVEVGDVSLEVRLERMDGAVVARQRASFRFDGRTGITLVITRSCRAVSCPGASDAPVMTACLRGECVDERCSPSTPESCPPPACSADRDCEAPPAACAMARCVGGECLAAADDRSCSDRGAYCDPSVGCVGGDVADAGMMDGGMPDACTPFVERCINMADDDCDRAVDCFDMDCQMDTACTPDGGPPVECMTAAECPEESVIDTSKCTPIGDPCSGSGTENVRRLRYDCVGSECASTSYISARPCTFPPPPSCFGVDGGRDGGVDRDGGWGEGGMGEGGACGLLEYCSNGSDDDCDGLTDCLDPDCVPDPGCGMLRDT